MKFKRGQSPEKSLRIGQSIFEKFLEHPTCKAINTPKGDEIDKDGNGDIWINPQNQKAFNSAWCTESDLEDWMNGKGKMVKGETDEEKSKFFEYAEWESTDSNNWSISYYFKYFNLLNSHNKNSVKHTMIKKDPLSVLNDVYSPWVEYFKRELEYREIRLLRHDMDDILFGVGKSLVNMGIGEFFACNTPESIDNHAWVPDLIYAKGLYLHLKEKGETFPDFEFIDNYYK